MNEKFLSELREAVQAFTEADPYFSGIEIINERLKDIEGKIEEQLGPLGGVCIVLVTPVVGGVLANVTGANFKDIRVVARVLENVTLNDTGKAALDVAIYLAALWSQARPDTFASALVPDEPTIALGNDPKYLSYDVTFRTESGTKIEIPRLTMTLGTPGGVLTALPSVAGAAVFYTLDGSAPIPRNPAAVLTPGPVYGPPGAALRARAWLAGYLPSAELRHTF